ncbi:chorismate mutase [Candidatus Schneideria nysicola]|uniref:prephenate dehydratase domain-containing protein n=1 Tax=Candidatus Schneideria nysicola TaxID=1081631 RepID=UPI001CAA4AD6|nr:prephenate dehydratase domain-containing protein [Candidatus Schneideria nysicola]UAJ65356.1 chorismate mutase [Candidatus Schneideria nysicola]
MCEEISRLREKINKIDLKILSLLSKRRLVSLDIAEIKITLNKPIRDEKREQELITYLISEGKKLELDEYYIIALFKIILEDSRIIQQRYIQKDNIPDIIRIAFLGPKGSYSYLAAKNYIRNIHNKIEWYSYNNFIDVIQSIEKEKTDWGILPLENTSSGLINEVHNLLQKFNIFIRGEVNLSINHCILTTIPTNLDKIKFICSHYQPFQQCSQFLSQFPQWIYKYYDSTSAAMKAVADVNNPHMAAIGSEESASLYNLKVIKKDIANKKDNITRFVVITRYTSKFSNQVAIPMKTTILIFIKNYFISSLLDIIQELFISKIIITRLELIPIYEDNKNGKVLFVDLEENLYSLKMQKILKNMRKKDINIKILGCYPIANILD